MRPPDLKNENSTFGQVTVEFTFCMVIVILLMYAVVKAFRWAGVDLAERRAASEGTFITNINEKWANTLVNTQGPGKQLVSNFYRTKRLGMVFNKW